jgi:two-component system, OmpR family, sensor histidine kinase CpxA
MRGLFFKIFIIFWIAQSLIYIISTMLIVRRHFDGPEVFFDALDSSLVNNARRAAVEYDKGGCQALRDYGQEIEQQIALKDASGRDLCDPAATAISIYATHNSARLSGEQSGRQYIWRVPVTSSKGAQYIFVLSRPHIPRPPSLQHDLMRLSFPQLPVAIVIGGLTTFVLVLLYTRPMVRLRTAARELASGKLNARVHWPGSNSRFSSGDELSGLMHDFNYMAAQLESQVSAQKLLLRDVSHELRSPLSRLSVALELAREDAGPSMVTNLDRIERETERLNQLIGQLLTLSSMEAMEKLHNFEPLSLNGMIERILPDAQFEAQQRPCTVAFHAETQCSIAGNPELLYRAIENVVRNAIRYTESGTEIEIRLGVSARRQAEIEICDRGPGIPESQLKAIFRPFYRVDNARSPNTGGFGVGLAIAERAVRLHGGEMSAINREGGGSIIRISLPLLKQLPATAA